MGPSAGNRQIAVWGLSEGIEDAIRVAAARESIEVCSAAEAREPLAVVGPAPATAAAHTEATRVGKLHRGAPVILLLGEHRAAAVHSYAHLLVPATPSSRTTALRLLRGAIDASEDCALSLVGGSAPMRFLRAELRLGASAPSTALLLGETGTGKGIAARALHQLSARSREPFETVDCAGLAPNLIESELFGHERGAFTGAYGRHVGKLERAAGGTLFLDEIGELDVGLQTRLLRALEERVFERVGGSTLQPLRARVVAATHRNLGSDVVAGRFRRDLLYRLDVLRFRVPALSERIEDIAALTDHLLLRAARRLERPAPAVADELIEALRRRPWPGNVRELANLLEALLVRSTRGELDSSSLAQRPLAGFAREAAYDEHGELSALLVACGGNVARVARRLGKPRSTVRSRISQLGLSRLLPRD